MMALLIDYLEESAAYLREKRERLRKLNAALLQVYDTSLKREIADLRRDIAKKNGEITTELLYSLTEFRALRKYFPDLLAVYMEDEQVGRILSKKEWLLDYKPMPPKEAAERLSQLKEWRSQLKEAKRSLGKWVGTVDSKEFVRSYPIMKGYLKADMNKADVRNEIDKVDKILLREGWLLLISDSLIRIPITKFMSQINRLAFEELEAKGELSRMRGKGTVAETAALRKLQGIQKRRAHYERILTQVLLANPDFLRSAKKRSWLSREKVGNFERLVASITPRSIKERAWLDEMRERIGGESPAEAAGTPAAQGDEEPKPEAAPKKARKAGKRAKGRG